MSEQTEQLVIGLVGGLLLTILVLCLGALAQNEEIEHCKRRAEARFRACKGDDCAERLLDGFELCSPSKGSEK